MLKAYALTEPIRYIVEEYVRESTPYTEIGNQLVCSVSWDFNTEEKAIEQMVREARRHPDRAYNIFKSL